jgi:hypothetical protein
MGPRQTAMLLILAAGQAWAQSAVSPAPIPSPAGDSAPAIGSAPSPVSGSVPSPGTGAAPQAAAVSPKRVLLPPTLQWDTTMQNYRPALQQTATDFANLTGGLAFGMSPTEVNARLPVPDPDQTWSSLTLANEYPGEARYFTIRLAAAGVLRMDLTACAGAASTLVFVFNPNGLLRLSYRVVADKSCPDTDDAAQEIFARYVPLGQRVGFSLRYRAGKTQVVDVSDPTAGYVKAVRWRQGGT